MAVCKFHFCHFLEVDDVAIEHNGPDLLDLVGLWTAEIFKSKMILHLFTRASIKLIVRTTVLVNDLIDVPVRRIKVALIIGDDLLLNSVDNQGDFDLDDPGDLHRNGVIFPLCMAGLLIVGNF